MSEAERCWSRRSESVCVEREVSFASDFVLEDIVPSWEDVSSCEKKNKRVQVGKIEQYYHRNLVETCAGWQESLVWYNT